MRLRKKRIKQIVCDSKYIITNVSFQGSAVEVHTNDHEELNDIVNRLTPYFQVNKGENQHTLARVYSIFDTELYNQFIRDFDSVNQKIIGHLGNTINQKREYKYFSYENNDIFQSLKNDTVIITDKDNSAVYVISNDKKKISLELRRVIKDNILSRLAEKNKSAVFHTAIASKDNKGIMIIGDKGAGKTTTLIKLLKDYNMNFVTSDRGYLKLNNNKIFASGWPEPLNVGYGSLKAFTLGNIINSEIIKKGQEKIVIPYNKIPQVLLNSVVHGTYIDTVLFPKINLDKSTTIEKLQLKDVIRRLQNSCLSPYDKEHPHWLKYVDLDENKYNIFLREFIRIMGKELSCYEINIGFDINQTILEFNKEK